VGKRGTSELKFPLYNTKKVIWKENNRTRKKITEKSATTILAKKRQRPTSPSLTENAHNPLPTREANTKRLT
jgi:hypothetical protein